MDLRYEVIKGRLSTLSKPELQTIIDRIDDICFDELNYDPVNHKYCPLAMGLDGLPDPTDEKVKEAIYKRFNPVNVIKGIPGDFYRESRKEDLLALCKNLLSK